MARATGRVLAMKYNPLPKSIAICVHFRVILSSGPAASARLDNDIRSSGLIFLLLSSGDLLDPGSIAQCAFGSAWSLIVMSLQIASFYTC